MKRLRMLMSIMSIMAASVSSAAVRDTSLLKGLTHRITAEIRPAYNLPTHGFYKGYNEFGQAVPMAGSAHLKYSFGLNPDSTIGRLYPTAYQGIGMAWQTFFNHKATGTPVLLYIFQGSRIADLGRKLSLDYEWNLGLSYGWRRNEVVGSECNIYINVGLPLTWHISPEWDLSFGPEYTHFSNGDTAFPNGGANTFGFRLGITNLFNASTVEKAPGRKLIGKEQELKTRKASERISYDINIYGAWRADRQIDGSHITILNKAFPTGGISINPLYRLNRYFSVGAAADLMIDKSADLDMEGNSPSAFYRQTALGISFRGELTMPFFSINIGAGYNVLSGADDLRGFFTAYNLKTFISDFLFLNIGYRLSSVLYSHNLMFGIGIRL